MVHNSDGGTRFERFVNQPFAVTFKASRAPIQVNVCYLLMALIFATFADPIDHDLYENGTCHDIIIVDRESKLHQETWGRFFYTKVFSKTR